MRDVYARKGLSQVPRLLKCHQFFSACNAPIPARKWGLMNISNKFPMIGMVSAREHRINAKKSDKD